MDLADIGDLALKILIAVLLALLSSRLIQRRHAKPAAAASAEAHAASLSPKGQRFVARFRHSDLAHYLKVIPASFAFASGEEGEPPPPPSEPTDDESATGGLLGPAHQASDRVR